MNENLKNYSISKKTVIFTGGGSGGHAIPLINIINHSLNNKYSLDMHFIGSINGIERKLVEKLPLKYYAISTGKLRRYISKENIIDIFKLLKGILQAFFIVIKIDRRATIFSTGGFVAVPVVIAGWLLRRKIIIHEQTTRIGLANKISSLFANSILIGFEDAKYFFPNKKTFYTGNPISSECDTQTPLYTKLENYDLAKIKNNTPILFFTGGGNGAQIINDFVKRNIEELSKKFFVIHQYGNGDYFQNRKIDNYCPIQFIRNEMISILKIADIVVSRAGAVTVSELLALKKRSIFIPLKIAQKNEQLHNAEVAVRQLQSIIVKEDDLIANDMALIDVIKSFSTCQTTQATQVTQTTQKTQTNNGQHISNVKNNTNSIQVIIDHILH